ncbi:hypothetical protein EDD18DRAFT_1352033 [Armillaria luteobubalina]|uniref:Uncharacterized protein n=1 Tax=Armillaria luteobubalina TaxID=153913 RepID=A0AA39UXJ9_9AGAR|nr:hypothetical protein EDD18DRAFT_1352033 [Armillaria luteobubalina]
MGSGKQSSSRDSAPFKPFQGEAVDGVFTNVNKMGSFAECRPLTVSVAHQTLRLTV